MDRFDPSLYTLEYCESLLRLHPAATAKLYHQTRAEAQKESAKMNAGVPTLPPPPATAPPTNNAESVHRWDVRRALLDGPKTAQQCANWARERRGNQHIDRSLAASILTNLMKAGEVALYTIGMDGSPDVYRLTETMKVPPPDPPSSLPDPGDTQRKALREAKDQAAKLQPGEFFEVKCPAGVSLAVFAQTMRNRLNSQVATRACRVNQMADRSGIVIRREAQLQNAWSKCWHCKGAMPPDFTVPAEWRLRHGAAYFCSEACRDEDAATRAPVELRPTNPLPSSVVRIEPIPNPRGVGRTIKLRSGGTATLELDVNLFALTAEDRAFVFDLIDHFQKYEENPVELANS